MSDDALPRLLDIMRRLRDPRTGCPWDLAQDFPRLRRTRSRRPTRSSTRSNAAPPASCASELGDLLFQVVFLSQLASEQGEFDFDDVARAIGDKLVARHPHVFAAEPGAESSARCCISGRRARRRSAAIAA